MARHPEDYIVQAGYAESIALTHSRKARDIFCSVEMMRLFPSIHHRPERPGQEIVIPERQAAHEWGTKQGGSYYAVGIGGGLTGRGFNIGIIDDPVKDAEEAASETIREKVWDWYRTVFRTRAQPDAAIIVVMCMTGDTPVLMGDGTERLLREIKVGDQVATYDNGKLATSMVLNHTSNGADYILKIRTTCGRIVKANERHPFLVEENGQLKWIRLKNLTTHHKIVTVRGSGASGKARFVPSRVAKSLLDVGDIARHTTKRRSGQIGIALHLIMQNPFGIDASSIATESPLWNMMRCTKHRAANALFANNPQEIMSERIGEENCVLTIATKLIQLEDSCVTTAISPLDMLRQKQQHSLLANISDFTTESIESIEPAGIEEVFDIQVERTENFIANGMVSHNTRWHPDDLVGRLLNQAKGDPASDQWEVLHFKALTDGKALWPAMYPLPTLEGIKASIGSRAFAALYQGEPTVAEGQIIKREWWQYFKEVPTFQRTIHSWDTAFKDKTQNDYSVCTVWGETSNGYYLLDVWRSKVEFPELKRVAISLYNRDRPNVVIVEDLASGQSLIQEIQRNTAIPVLPIKVDSNKVARVNSVTPLIEAGRVFLPENAPWLYDYIEELSAFPNAEHDDQVDSTTQALSFMRGLPGPVEKVVYYDAMKELEEDIDF